MNEIELLCDAAANGDIPKIKQLLLDKDINTLNVKNSDGMTPFKIAIINGKIEAVEFFLEQGISTGMDISEVLNLFVDTSNKKHEDMIILLLKKIPAWDTILRKNHCTYYDNRLGKLLNCTFFHIIASNEQNKVCEYFTHSNTSHKQKNLYGINTKDSAALSPLHVALDKGKFSTVEILIKLGADTKGLLHIMAKLGNNEGCIYALDKGYSAINERHHKKNELPLGNALLYNNHATVELLIR